MSINSPDPTSSLSPNVTTGPRSDMEKALSEEATVRHHIILLTFFGIIAIVAALFTTVIDWTVLGWRTAWLGICIAAFIGLLASVVNLFNFAPAKTKAGRSADFAPTRK
jgi:hypothetical protein